MPCPSAGGAGRRVLAGLRAKENMQSLIQQEAFEGNALSCIIDPTGKVIISQPT